VFGKLVIAVSHSTFLCALAQRVLFLIVKMKFFSITAVFSIVAPTASGRTEVPYAGAIAAEKRN
jgi:hypothetical protein